MMVISNIILHKTYNISYFFSKKVGYFKLYPYHPNTILIVNEDFIERIKTHSETI